MATNLKVLSASSSPLNTRVSLSLKPTIESTPSPSFMIMYLPVVSVSPRCNVSLPSPAVIVTAPFVVIMSLPSPALILPPFSSVIVSSPPLPIIVPALDDFMLCPSLDSLPSTVTSLPLNSTMSAPAPVCTNKLPLLLFMLSSPSVPYIVPVPLEMWL